MFKGKKIFDGDGLYVGTTKNFFRAGLHGVSRCLKASMHDASVCLREPIGAAIRTRCKGEWIKGEKHTPKVEFGKNVANSLTSVSKDSLVVETRLRIRRLTPRECFRLMDVDEEYIDRMLESGVSKSSLQKAAGNSIVVACMERILEELWFPESKVKVADDGQLCLF